MHETLLYAFFQNIKIAADTCVAFKSVVLLCLFVLCKYNMHRIQRNSLISFVEVIMSFGMSCSVSCSEMRFTL